MGVGVGFGECVGWAVLDGCVVWVGLGGAVGRGWWPVTVCCRFAGGGKDRTGSPARARRITAAQVSAGCVPPKYESR